MATTERNLRWRLGIFVLIMLVLAGALIILFGSAPTLFKRTTTYTILFDDAPNVSVGTPVRRSGVRIGEVREVKLDDTIGKVKVVIGIDPGNVVRQSDRPTLVSSGILGGDANIDFIPEKQVAGGPPPDLTPVPPGSELIGFRQATVSTVLDQAQGLTPKAEKTLDDISKALKELKEMKPLIEDTLKAYRDLAREAQPLVPELKKTNDEIQGLVRDLRPLAPELRKTNDQIQGLARDLRPVIPEVRKTNEELQKTLPVVRDTFKQVGDLANDARPLVPELRETNKQAQAALKEIAETARSANVVAKRLDEWTQNGGRITLLIDRITDAAGRVNDVLSDENRRSIAKTLKNTEQASIHFPDIARNLSHVLEDLSNTTGPLRERGPTIIRNLDQSLDKLNSTLADVQQVVRSVGNSEGTVMKLLADPSLYNRLDEILCGLSKQIPKIDRIVSDAGTFADRIARHPELLGVRGIAGSDGTKPNNDLPPLPPNSLLPRH
jgi:phospholipid/cholesterol/gamma-HCH transport system substrate-binding protein